MEKKITFDELPSAIELLIKKVEQLYDMIYLSNKEQTVSIKQSITTNDAAKILKITKQTVYEYVKKQNLPHIKLKKKLYFYEEELISWMEKRRARGKAKTPNEVGLALSILKRNH